jgi:hypothetical protein
MSGRQGETMSRLFRLLTVSSALLALGACAYNQPGAEANLRAKADRAWARGPDLAESQRGDWKVALEFSERSYKQTPDIINEFNLATAYQRTGNNALAIPLYIDLEERGQYTPLATLLNYDGTLPKHVMLRTVSLEAAARLKPLDVDAGQRTTIALASSRTME